MELNIEFKKNTYPGIYIAIEGIDGSGKSTQVRVLKSCFQTQGRAVTIIHEPRKVRPIAKFIHEVLCSETSLGPVALQYLFAADRTVQLSETIIPLLKKGKVIISDRSFWSSVPYGLADKVGIDYSNLKELENIAQGILTMYNGFIMPDAVIFLDVSVETAIKRLNKRKKEQEIYEKRTKLEKIKAGYDWLVNRFKENFISIDGNKSVNENTKEIIKHMVKWSL